jgi:hypothetical protein
VVNHQRKLAVKIHTHLINTDTPWEGEITILLINLRL